MGKADKKRLKAAAKQEKKRLKAIVKLEKKRAKAAPQADAAPQTGAAARADAPPQAGAAARPDAPPQADAAPPAPPAERPSPAVRLAEWVRGILYLILGASLIVALILGQQGVILSLDDIIESLFAAAAGKIVLSLIALALVIYGLKQLRLAR